MRALNKVIVMANNAMRTQFWRVCNLAETVLYISHNIAKLFSHLLLLPWPVDMVEVVLVKWFNRKVSKRRSTILELPNQNAKGALRNKSVFFLC